MKFLVGYSGFVGQNLLAQTHFDGCFNSSNIKESFGGRPDLLLYSGLRAEKFLANNEPEKDRASIDTAFANIKKIAPRMVVLISTIDVYRTPSGVDESADIEFDEQNPYGMNRRMFEIMVTDAFPNTLIVRLPGLFGTGLKKNFIFDLINVIPTMLTNEKLVELENRDPAIREYYTIGTNGFYQCSTRSENDRGELRAILERIDFSAARFTDSRAVFQFYNLAHIWSHIQIALNHKLSSLNMATEPVSAREVYQRVTGRDFENELPTRPPYYDFHTRHAALLGGNGRYAFGKERILADIAAFAAGKVVRDPVQD